MLSGEGVGSTSRRARAEALRQFEAADDYRALTVARDGMQVGVGIDPDQVERVLDMLSEMAPGLIEAADDIVREEARGFKREIAAAWPVDTGFSRGEWTTLELGPAVQAVVNPAIYSGHVHYANETEPIARRIEREARDEVLPRVARKIAMAARRIIDEGA